MTDNIRNISIAIGIIFILFGTAAKHPRLMIGGASICAVVAYFAAQDKKQK